jgi:capsular exopolysaccharide synthesis family protein
MSRLYESLKRAEMESGQPEASPNAGHAPELSGGPVAALFELENLSSATMDIPSQSHLIALTEPRCLAAEKFRVLVTRLQNLRKERELKSLLVTSSVINEGKTFVAGNLAVTLANHSGSRVLLVEGDLHRPALASLLGLTGLQGLSHWWSGGKGNIAQYVYRVNGMPLWFLGAGEACDQPSQILQSAEFTEALAQLSGAFDWILVDSPPMLPTVDVNLWSRLVDGMLLVVREGVAPIRALEQGLASVDKPKLVGIVLNEASELGRTKYADPYYENSIRAKTNPRKTTAIA